MHFQVKIMATYLPAVGVKEVTSLLNKCMCCQQRATRHFLLLSPFLFAVLGTIAMLIYSIHTQRDHTARHLCLSNIGYLAKRSVPWSILIRVALETHGPIRSPRRWSAASKALFRQKSGNNGSIVLHECRLIIGGGLKSGWLSLQQLKCNYLGVKICWNGSKDIFFFSGGNAARFSRR